MSSDPNQATPDLSPKPMKGKYDKRKYNGAHKAAVNNRGRKPNWVKHLERNDAGRKLEKSDSIATVEEIYASAWEKKNLPLCLEIRRQLTDRFLDRPFIAENPQKANNDDAIKNDQKLQNALRTLLPGTPAKPSVM